MAIWNQAALAQQLYATRTPPRRMHDPVRTGYVYGRSDVKCECHGYNICPAPRVRVFILTADGLEIDCGCSVCVRRR